MDNQNAQSVKDVIKKSFLESKLLGSAMTLDTITTIAISLVASLLIGMLIYFVYKKSFRGVVYSHSFAITLMGMTILTCMITLAISTNVVLSLGMVGALSIVRYRTAIKEPMDLLFIFWGISSGIAVGASMYLLVGVTAVVIIIMLIILDRRKIGGQVYIMIVHYNGDDIGDEIRRIMRNIRYRIKSKTMRSETTEMAVEVFAKKDNLTFAEQIRSMTQVNDVTLIQYNGEYHG
jgi:hypothetical protein